MKELTQYPSSHSQSLIVHLLSLFPRLCLWSSQHNTPVPTHMTAQLLLSFVPKAALVKQPTHTSPHSPDCAVASLLFQRLHLWSNPHTPVPPHRTAQLLLFCSKGCTHEVTHTHQSPLTGLHNCFSFVPKAALVQQPTHTSPHSPDCAVAPLCSPGCPHEELTLQQFLLTWRCSSSSLCPSGLTPAAGHKHHSKLH